MFGDIELADDIKVGANAVVNHSFRTKGAHLVGVPAHETGQTDPVNEASGDRRRENTEHSTKGIGRGTQDIECRLQNAP